MTLDVILNLKTFQNIFVIQKFWHDWYVVEAEFISIVGEGIRVRTKHGNKEVDINNEDAFFTKEEAEKAIELKNMPKYFEMSFVHSPYVIKRSE